MSRLLVVIGPVLVAAACAHDATGPTAATVVTASVVVAPAPGASDVARNGSVSVTFNYPMDSASCASRFAMRQRDTSGAVVPGRMSWDSTYHRMTFAPDSMLAVGTLFYVQMRDSMMTRDYMMRDSVGMGGGGMMGGTGGGQHQMPGAPMMFNQPPAGATRTGGGMQWSFTTAP